MHNYENTTFKIQFSVGSFCFTIIKDQKEKFLNLKIKLNWKGKSTTQGIPRWSPTKVLILSNTV